MLQFMERSSLGAALAASTGGLGSCSRRSKRRAEDAGDSVTRAKRLHVAQELVTSDLTRLHLANGLLAAQQVTPTPPACNALALWTPPLLEQPAEEMDESNGSAAAVGSVRLQLSPLAALQHVAAPRGTPPPSVASTALVVYAGQPNLVERAAVHCGLLQRAEALPRCVPPPRPPSPSPDEKEEEEPRSSQREDGEDAMALD